MFAQNNQLSTLQELTVDEFRNITGMSINQICNLTGADRDAVLRHRKKADSDRSQHVQFRRHLGLLAQSIKK